MPKKIITCPSGLIGEIRGLKGREMNIMTDRSALKAGSAFDEILRSCWLGTEDLGIYGGDKAFQWSNALLCDRFFALINIRALTFGDAYEFKIRCEWGACDEFFPWSFTLPQLPVRMLADPVKAKLRAGDNRFDFVFPGVQKRATFKLLTGQDERTLVERQKKLATSGKAEPGKQGLLLTALVTKIIEIEGVTSRTDFLAELDYADLRAIGDEIDKVDGGFETEIGVLCPHCQTEQDVEIPFGREFWTPRKKPVVTPDP